MTSACAPRQQWARSPRACEITCRGQCGGSSTRCWRHMRAAAKLRRSRIDCGHHREILARSESCALHPPFCRFSDGVCLGNSLPRASSSATTPTMALPTCGVKKHALWGERRLGSKRRSCCAERLLRCLDANVHGASAHRVVLGCQTWRHVAGTDVLPTGMSSRALSQARRHAAGTGAQPTGASSRALSSARASIYGRYGRICAQRRSMDGAERY